MRVISMRSARGVVAGMCALLAMVAGSCGGGGGGSTSSNPPPPSSVSITISPTSATVGFGGTDQFTATVSGTAKTGVTWSVKDSSGGTSHVGAISSAGLYTAPAATSATTQASIQTVSVTAGHPSSPSSVNVTVPELNAVNSVTVTATSRADSTKSASATVTLSGLSIVGLGQCTQSGTTLNCSAGSTGTPVSRGQTVYIFIVGYGIVPGTTYAISGSDVTIPQQPTSANNNFVTTKDGTPAVFFQITISPTAALGQRNIAVTNSGGELSAFPGGLQITQ